MWTTSVIIPELNKKTATAFMEMFLAVAKLSKIPKRAIWSVTHVGTHYIITADFKKILYTPLKKRPKIIIRATKPQ